MTELLLLGIGLIAGGAAAWFLSSSRSSGTVTELRARVNLQQTTLQAKDQEINSLHQQLRAESEAKVAAQTRLGDVEASLEDQKKLLEDARQKLSDTFKALAADTLRDAHGEFLTLAKGELAKAQSEATGALEAREKAVEGLVRPLRESLERYERQIQEIEKGRRQDYGSLDKQLQDLQRVTGSLDVALRTPQARGRWGEMTLRRVAELSGMVKHCDFTEQETLFGEAGRLRPDMIVHLPGGRRIAVDAKVPLQAFLDAMSAASEPERLAHLTRHAQQVRSHMLGLAAKNYWAQLEPAPDLVILFLPGESFFSAAIEKDRTLIEEGIEKRVLLATPTTFIALLRSVVHGWQQQRLSENASAISELGKDLYSRMKIFADHFAGVGSALGKAVESYNRASGSLESRLLVAARRFKEFGAGNPDEITTVEPLDERPRSLSSPDWNGEPDSHEAEHEGKPNSEGNQTFHNLI